MYFLQREHNPPHIHAIYGEHVAAVEIESKRVLEGALPPKALAMVIEWMTIRQEELLKIWETQDFKHLPPWSKEVCLCFIR